jgi:hypothetical protein
MTFSEFNTAEQSFLVCCGTVRVVDCVSEGRK